ncbi:fluoride efflux transporter CrcB [Selenomonas ruminantium]|uniref:Fluoride-specific ion channel FluC n=1 Tax=Selenomonas ruminantium TaxID=971 RepID=A0A1K1NL67_SELRU|nr:fluoride efflux transporter CrcB [Selenomonas ruminantium]SFW36210.1 CrcB protein [Selenomonas ruminantium]
MQYLYVFLGGGLGAVCRYLATTAIGARFGMMFPFGTLFVNTLGSFLMALIMGFLLTMAKANNLLSEPLRLLLTVGFLGGFTTFSSFSMETLTLIRSGSIALAIANIVANVLLGLIAAILGLYLAAMIQGAKP